MKDKISTRLKPETQAAGVRIPIIAEIRDARAIPLPGSRDDTVDPDRNMDVLKCKSVDNVRKEALMFVLVYNLVRMVIRAAARRQHVDIERISFIDAVRWILSATPGKPLGPLVINPARPGRYEPRVRKRRPKQYPLMAGSCVREEGRLIVTGIRKELVWNERSDASGR